MAFVAGFNNPPRLYLKAIYAVLFGLLVLFAALCLLLVGVVGAFIPAVLLLGAGVLAIAALLRPVPTMLAMLVLIPLSRFMSMLVYAATGSELALRGTQMLKDEILLVLIVAVTNLAFLRRRPPKVYYLDLLIMAYIFLAVLYMFYMGPDGENTNVFAKLLALRQDGFYVLAYFVGRGIPLTRNTAQRAIRILVGLSVVLAAIAAFQFAFPDMSNTVFGRLGFHRFMAAIGPGHEELAVRSRGIAGADLPRSSSLFLSDLGLAFYQLLLVPLAAAFFFYTRRIGLQLGYGAFLLMMLAVLAMTITRSAIAAGIVGLAFVLVRTAAYPKAAAVALVGLALAFVAALTKDIDPARLQALFSTEEGSALAHINLIENAVQLLKEYPLGLGLGNGSHVANLVGSSAGLQVSPIESWYFQLSLEMGVVGMLLFAVILAIATLNAIITCFRVREPLLRVITVAVAGTGLSLFVISLVQPVWAAVHVTYLFWLLAGISVRALTLEAEWHSEKPD